MSFRVGVDIGGTFTDFCAYDDATETLHTLKVSSTPATPGAEVLNGMRGLRDRHGIAAEEVAHFVHGTTVGINTVIQRKGASLALFPTHGFADVLELARLRMPEIFSLYSTRPTPLIPRHRVFPIHERVLADGTVARPVEREEILAAFAAAQAEGVEGIVVSFVNAYRNPVHERAVRDIIAEVAPDFPVFISTDVWPVIREYERTVTTTLAGYVQRRVAHYLGSLQQALRDHGAPCEPLITKSNGGVMSAETGKRECVQMLLSGTASGVIGAAFVAGLAGVKDVLTLDIGGTSADVALIVDGKPQYGSGELIGEFPLHIPTVSVSSIGDGGGSIAWLDEQGVLRVGPESAGSDPGPACYGKGGTRPTITDAFAVCGYLGGAPLGYDSITVNRALAEEAVATVTPPGGDIRARAQAIIEIALSGMFLEVNKIIARHGVDVRSFSLMTFGGAGPMLGCLLARELGMRHVLVPATPGVVSALGGLVADLKNDFIQTLYTALDEAALPHLRASAEALRRRALAWLIEEQDYAGTPELILSADMHYKGQSFEIEVPLEAAWIADGNLAAIAAAFHARHEAVYGISDTKAPVRLVNLRAVAIGRVAKPRLKKLARGTGSPESETLLTVHYDGRTSEVPRYRRTALLAGQRFAGPAVVAQDDATTCIPAGFDAVVDDYGNILLTRAD